MIASEDKLFMLYNDRSLEIAKAEDMKESIHSVKQVEGTKEIVAMAHVASKNELWVGDKDGLVYILSADTLQVQAEPLKTVYGHPVMSMASSSDGLVAIGDTKGYVTVVESETRAQKCYYALHKNKVLEIQFTADGKSLVTLSFDKVLCVASVDTPTQSQKLISK